MGRLSNHRFCANYFRLYLHALAMNLAVRMRRLVTLPEPPRDEDALPSEALEGPERQEHFRQRRRRDVLGEGQPATWRRMLLEVAVQVVHRGRRILIRLSTSWAHLEQFQQVFQRLLAALALRASFQ